MFSVLRWFFKNLPTLLLSFALSLTVWISAVSAADPVESRIYPRSVTVEVIGQNPGLLLTSEIPNQVTLRLSAPVSIWDRLLNEQVPVRAVIDLSGLSGGTHIVNLQMQVGIRPVEIVSYSPHQVTITLEALSSRELPIRLVQRGEIAVGFQADGPRLGQDKAIVSGPESIVDQVREVRAVLDASDIQESIDRQLPLVAVDADGSVLNGLTISPDQVHATLQVTQRGGYRNVVVKVVVNGQVASGYRVTNISVFPPTVTVYSSDPKLVDQLPGYVETSTLDLNAAKDDQSVQLPLDLPPGVSLVGDPHVQVQVGIAAITGSVTLEGLQVDVIGVSDGLRADLSPLTVDIILSGPLPVLDQLKPQDVHVTVDLSGEVPGIYQRVPIVEFDIEDLRVESILPASVEINLKVESRTIQRTTATPTPVLNITPSPSPTQ